MDILHSISSFQSARRCGQHYKFVIFVVVSSILSKNSRQKVICKSSGIEKIVILSSIAQPLGLKAFPVLFPLVFSTAAALLRCVRFVGARPFILSFLVPYTDTFPSGPQEGLNIWATLLFYQIEPQKNGLFLVFLSRLYRE